MEVDGTSRRASTVGGEEDRHLDTADHGDAGQTPIGKVLTKVKAATGPAETKAALEELQYACQQPENTFGPNAKAFVEELLAILKRIPVSYQANSDDQPILSAMTEMLYEENHLNAALALKIIIDMHKNYREQKMEQGLAFGDHFTDDYLRKVLDNRFKSAENANAQYQSFLKQKSEADEDLPRTGEQIQAAREAIASIYKKIETAKASAQSAQSNATKRLEQLTVSVQRSRQGAESAKRAHANIQAQALRRGLITSTGVPKDVAPALGEDPNQLLKGIYSFKVLTECPIVIVLLYQLYNGTNDAIKQLLPDFVPLAMSVLSHAPQLKPRPPADIKERHREFIGAQLLNSAPSNSAQLRKELLIAVRHILASDFRKGFVTQIDKLMDEELLVGKGWSCREILRPLAFSTLADLVHHVRKDLQMPQLRRAIHLFLRNVQDTTLPVNIQTMSCKLLLNLAEMMGSNLSNTTAVNYRQLLMHIFAVFVSKMNSLASWNLARLLQHHHDQHLQEQRSMQAAAAVEATKSRAPQADIDSGDGLGGTDSAVRNSRASAESASDDEELAACVDTPLKRADSEFPPLISASEAGFLAGDPGNCAPSDLINTDLCTPVQSHSQPDETIDSIKDLRFLVKTLITGLKILVWVIAQCNQLLARSSTAPQATPPAVRTVSSVEVFLFFQLWRSGLKLFDLYAVNADGSWRPLQGTARTPVKHSSEEKEFVESFASVWTSIDHLTFREVVTPRVDLLLDRIFDNNLLLIVPQQLLSNKETSAAFAYALLEHLVSNLKLLGQEDENRALVRLRLFKLTFGSIALMPDTNEQILQPHLQTIIHDCMQYAPSAKEPLKFFLLLRALFRSIGGGKFELLYKEFLPLLPNLLARFNQLLLTTTRQQLRDLLVELCLTVPVRLSALLPHLHFLMRPLVLALRATDDLVSQGLRTLELCIDNLTPEFLDPVIDPVRQELMLALWSHMKPRSATHSHGEKALRILGKLAGRNREEAIKAPSLEPEDLDGTCLRVLLAFDQENGVHLPLDHMLPVALDVLRAPQGASYKRDAFELLKASFASVLDLESTSSPDTTLLACMANRIPLPSDDYVPILDQHHPRPRTRWHDTMLKLLQGLVLAAQDTALREEATLFLKGVLAHFALLACEQHHRRGQAAPARSEKEKSVLQHMDVIVEACAWALCQEATTLPELGRWMLQDLLQSCIDILGHPVHLCELPLAAAAVSVIYHSCHEHVWYRKQAGLLGVSVLLEILPPEMIRGYCVHLMRAMIASAASDVEDSTNTRSEEAQVLVKRLIDKAFDDTPFNLASRPARFSRISERKASESMEHDDHTGSMDVSADVDSAEDAAASESASVKHAARKPSDGASSLPGSAPRDSHGGGQTSGGEASAREARDDEAATPEADKPPARDELDAQEQIRRGDVVRLLIKELVAREKQVRQLAMNGLHALARKGQVSVAYLLETGGFKSMAVPKTARSTPIAVQIGRMDALRFCLSISPPLLSFDPPSEAGATPAQHGNASSTPSTDTTAGTTGGNQNVAGAATAQPSTTSSGEGAEATTPASSDTQPKEEPTDGKEVANDGKTQDASAPSSMSATTTPSAPASGHTVPSTEATTTAGNSQSAVSSTDQDAAGKPASDKPGDGNSGTPGEVTTTPAADSNDGDSSQSSATGGHAAPTASASAHGQPGSGHNSSGSSSSSNSSTGSYFRELLQICKLSDQSANHAAKPLSHISAELITELRVQAILLMATIMTNSAWHSELRAVSEIFVSMLLSDSKPVAQAAFEALQMLHIDANLAAEELKTVLRLSVDFGDFNKVTPNRLHALKHMLKIVPVSYFNETLTTTLLKYLMQCAEHITVNSKTNSVTWTESRHIAISKAILAVLVEMDSLASRRVTQAIDIVLNVHAAMGRHISSPLLQEAVQLTCRFPAETFPYLVDKISSQKHASLLLLALQEREAGAALRNTFVNKADVLIERIFVPGDHALRTATTLTQQISASSVQYTAVAMLKEVGRYHPDLLSNKSSLLDSLVKLWNYTLAWNSHQEAIPPCRSNEPRLLLMTLLEALPVVARKADVLYNLLPIFTSRSLMDLGFARSFFFNHLGNYHVTVKRDILLRLLSYINDAKQTQAVKAVAIERVIAPLVASAIQKGELDSLLRSDESSKAQTFFYRLLSVLQQHDYSEVLDDVKMALIHLLGTIGQNAKNHAALRRALAHLYRDYIAFIYKHFFKGENEWNLDDVALRQAGTLVLVYFVDAFEFYDGEMMMEMYLAIIDGYSSEAKNTSRQALAILQPLMTPERLEQKQAAEWHKAQAAQPTGSTTTTPPATTANSTTAPSTAATASTTVTGTASTTTAPNTTAATDGQAQVKVEAQDEAMDTRAETAPTAASTSSAPQGAGNAATQSSSGDGQVADAKPSANPSSTTEASTANNDAATTTSAALGGENSGEARDDDASQSPAWVAKIQDVLIRDQSSQVQLVLPIFCAAPELFLPFRSQLAQPLAMSLRRLSQQNSPDLRKLLVDTAELLIRWDLDVVARHTEGNGDHVAPTTLPSAPASQEALVAVAAQAKTESASAGHIGAPATSAPAAKNAHSPVRTAASSMVPKSATTPGGETSAARSSVGRAPKETASPRRVEPASGGSETPPDRLLSRRCQELILNLLVLTISQPESSNDYSSKSIPHRCLRLINQVMHPQLWLDAHLSIARFEKLFYANVDRSSSTNVVHVYTLVRLLILFVRRLPMERWGPMLGGLRKALIAIAQSMHTKLNEAFDDLVDNICLKLRQYGPPATASSGALDSATATPTTARSARGSGKGSEGGRESSQTAPSLAIPDTPAAVAAAAAAAIAGTTGNNNASSSAAAAPGLHRNQVPPSLRSVEEILTLLEQMCEAKIKPAEVGDAYPNLLHHLKLLTRLDSHGRHFAKVDWKEMVTVLCKVLLRAQKDHLNSLAPPGPAQPGSTPPSEDDVADVIHHCVLLISPRLRSMDTTQRAKSFIAVLLTLVDKTENANIMKRLCKYFTDWTIDESHDVMFPLKDKAMFMARVQAAVVSRGFKDSSVLETFLECIMRIFTTPRLRNTDLTQRLEPGFLTGLRSPSDVQREAFFALFDEPNKVASLFDRLDYCFSHQTQRWENAGHTFWLKHCLDIVLHGAVLESPVVGSKQVLCLPTLQVVQDMESDAGVTAACQQIVEHHGRFLHTMRSLSLRGLTKSLRSLGHLKPTAAQALWMDLFPLMWPLLKAEEKKVLAASLDQLLQNPFHVDQALVRPSNVKALLVGISRCANPSLSLSVQLLHHLAMTHNLWHTCIHMIGAQISRTDQRDQSTAGKLDPARDALADLYLQLNERDTWYGQWRLRAKLTETSRALGWEQQAFWEQAQGAYEAAVQKTQQKGGELREAEFQLWEEHWIDCTRRLGQHDLLLKLAEENHNRDLMVESAWKLRKWRVAKDALDKLGNHQEANMRSKLHKAIVLMSSNDALDPQAVVGLYEDAVRLGLQDWVRFPEIVGAAHVPLLQQYQRLVEVQESSHVLAAHMPVNRGRYGPQEVSNTLDAWRHRMPCLWDEMNTWDDLLLWRQFVYERLTSLAGPTTKSDPAAATNHEAAFKDMASTLNRLAHTAREHRIRSVCERRLQSLHNLGKVPPSELFVKAREHVLCEMQLAPDDFEAQMDVINGITLGHFSQEQNGELLALKASVLHRKGEFKEANRLFSAAVRVADDVGYSWLAWHRYCDHMFSLAATHAASEARNLLDLQERGNDASATGGEPGAKRPNLGPDGANSGAVSAEQLNRQRDLARSQARQAREWGVASMMCAMTALRCKISSSETQGLVARCLMLLSKDDTAAIGNAFTKMVDVVDASVWKAWIPQLSTALSRPELPHIMTLVLRLAKQWPQATYYHLRTAFLDNRAAQHTADDMNRRGLSTGGDSSSKRAKMEDGTAEGRGREADPRERIKTALKAAGSAMQMVRNKHSMLAAVLENLIDEVVVRFKSTHEEELLRTLRVLLDECLKAAFMMFERGPAMLADAGAPAQVRMHLRRLLESGFAAPHPLAARREDFRADFSGIQNMPMSVCVDRLRRWHKKIADVVAERPTMLRLEEISRVLSQFTPSLMEVELPGEHMEERLHAHSIVRIESFLPDVEVVRIHWASYRRLKIRGRDGKVYSFLVQNTPARFARTEERYQALLRLINPILRLHKESAKRGLQFTIPRTVPLSPHVRLLMEPSPHVSLEDVLEHYCEHRETANDPEHGIMTAYNLRMEEAHRVKREAGNKKDNTDKQQLAQFRRDAFDRIRRQLVPSEALSRYLAASFPDHDRSWAFKQRFTSQLALSAFASRVFYLSKGQPYTFRFSLQTGNIVVWELAPSLDKTAQVVSLDPVPFRLTPNLVNFVTPAGITGIFSGSMVATAQALNNPDHMFAQLFEAIMRDELIAYYSVMEKPYDKGVVDNGKLVSKVEENRRQVMAARLAPLARYEGLHCLPPAAHPLARRIALVFFRRASRFRTRVMPRKSHNRRTSGSAAAANRPTSGRSQNSAALAAILARLPASSDKNGPHTASSTKKSAQVLTAAPIPKNIEEWFQSAKHTLVQGCGAVTPEKAAQAKQKIKDLSTSSDTVGIRFTGAALHQVYFATKFDRRGCLLFQLLAACWRASPSTSNKGKTHLATLSSGTTLTATTALTSASGTIAMPPTTTTTSTATLTTPATHSQASLADAGRRLQLFCTQPTPLRVASIGGGPGTDAAAFKWLHSLYFSPAGLTTPVELRLLDYEGSWKRHLSRLQDLLAPECTVAFHRCDVTQSMAEDINHDTRVVLADTDLYIFSYVCHETSAAAQAAQHAFYTDLAATLQPGNMLVFVDVMDHSRRCLKLVCEALQTACPHPTSVVDFLDTDGHALKTSGLILMVN
ncbi:uncharacterized protein MONBRDRAFT_10012 [Monosiga brevicollis MX1]|uniref:Non-specific serine/threonine protein kinase n=1 Tax=Monosiga brevicollis TaxID=81824 RepID=A9V4X9_MONBE|nr:uncharacterized protein MONBRDRAFT_10012 [Monosiga brevicollis MX1]EDQ87449.1 predicted protein [Monosiga brevicollis MX1]|eukprot:XP_001747709.1 hypothetical protein [Monosiga brevicollis MX1]